MSIWHTAPERSALNTCLRGTLGEHLDMRFETWTAESLSASMVVDRRTHQPMGLLHGGASVALAETVGSVASMLCIDPERSTASVRRSTPTTCARSVRGA